MRKLQWNTTRLNKHIIPNAIAFVININKHIYAFYILHTHKLVHELIKQMLSSSPNITS